MNHPQSILAIFDFDGTITYKDSFLDFIKFYKGKTRFWIGVAFISPVYILFRLNIISDQRAKEIVLSYFFNGESVSDFDEKCTQFGRKRIPSFIRKNALDKLMEHQNASHHIIVISASAESWLRTWCNDMKIELIGSRLEVTNGKITGKLIGKNCRGKEKVRRLKEILNPESYDRIFAYGDSEGDKEILEIATDPHYRLFH
ncbi:HAD-IB family hydrolase [candidate division KSB1 bacterium]